jgi:hypothetical protein
MYAKAKTRVVTAHDPTLSFSKEIPLKQSLMQSITRAQHSEPIISSQSQPKLKPSQFALASTLAFNKCYQ